MYDDTPVFQLLEETILRMRMTAQQKNQIWLTCGPGARTIYADQLGAHLGCAGCPYLDRCYDEIALGGLDWVGLSQEDDDWLMSRIEHHAEGHAPWRVAELTLG